MKSIETTSKML